MITCDVVVVGCGGVGSAAVMHLARRGLRVVGLDRFTPPHDRGSSHGRTRMIRQAYFEHADYVPLVLRAYRLWSELEQAAATKLYHETGLLEIGPPDGIVVPGVMAAAARHGLDVSQLSANDVRRNFPGFVVADGMIAAYERRAGYLRVEQCIAAHLDQARAAGAVIRSEESVQHWNATGSGVVVTTDREQYRANKLVITAGPWAATLLEDLNIALHVRRKPQYWFGPAAESYRADRGCPAFLYETRDAQRRDAGVFYGFPIVGPEGLKCAEHSGGGDVADPLNLNRDVDDADLGRVRGFLNNSLPGVTTTLVDHAACMYTMSPDENFIVDRHPRHNQVVFAAGLSGHGFKFTSVLGEALADLATTGSTELPIGFLGLKRFQS